MKKQMTTLAMGLALTLGATAASAENPLDYASATIAQQVHTDSDADSAGFTASAGTALIISGGKQMESIHQYFSVEGEFGYSLGAPAYTGDTGFGNITAETKIMTLGGYAAFNLPIVDKLSFKARLGMVYHSAETTASGIGCDSAFVDCSSASDTGTDVAYGGGLEYQLNDQFGIETRWTVIGSNTINSGIGASFNF